MFKKLLDRAQSPSKKPKVWSIAVLSVVFAAALAVLLTRPQFSVPAIAWLIRIYLAAVIVLLLRAFLGQLRYNPYSYNTLYYIGFALYLLSTLIYQFYIGGLVNQLGIPPEESIRTMLGGLLSSAKFFMLVSAPFILLFSVGLCASNLSLIRHEGRRPVNLLGILLAFLMVGGELFLFFSDWMVSGSMVRVMVHDLLVNLFAALYLYYECMIIGTILANLIVVRYEPLRGQDYVVILGCGLRKDGTPTPLLAGRIDRALAFYHAQLQETGRAPILIPSGGQGSNEVTSEAASMTAYLLEKGVPQAHILPEDQSTSTFENMKFSKEKMETPRGKVAFATTNYHIFRSGLMARRVKLNAMGMGARTRWYFWPNAAVREFVGLLTEHRLKQGLILGGMVLLYSAGTLLHYLL